MPRDLTGFLWLLKLGALANLYFLADTFALAGGADPHIVVPAQILFAVSAHRCLFPNRYEDDVVLHDSFLSSTFVTRVLATFVEIAWIHQLAHVLRVLDAGQTGWVTAFSWWMVVQVVVSQGFVWGAILTGRLSLYFFEEAGWAVIFVLNTVASAYLYGMYGTLDAAGDARLLLQLNLLFGAVYLPWQVVHLRALRADALASVSPAARDGGTIRDRLRRSLHDRKRATDAASWGGWIGLVWMAAYWAVLIPPWVHQIVRVLGTR
ncbi:MAG: hypothetical protein HKP30_15140 [Myxococcales bacterium]|nr:hypothetical protein [Myxococcales bacterium]